MGYELKIEADLKLDFSSVLIRPKPNPLSSRRDVELKREFRFPNSPLAWAAFPIVASNMDTVGTIKMATALANRDACAALSKYYSIVQLEKFFRKIESRNSFFSMGSGIADLEKLRELRKKVPISKICIEIANGYIDEFPKLVRTVRAENPDSIIMAGSVCTPDMTQILIEAGADIIRVGIGSGSVCTTRKVTGVGYPQLSAVIECSDAAHGLGGLVCSDGGCTVPGDICKAFGGGADFVMLGGMLAGHIESEGKIRYASKQGKKIPVGMQFYGMASKVAQQKHFGGMSSYRAAEGKVVEVPYRGAVNETIDEISGGVRSMMTYIGAKDLSEIPANTSFVRVTNQLNTVYGE